MFCVEEELRQSTLAQTGKLESDTLADLEDSELFEMDQMTRLGKCDRPSGTPPKSPNQRVMVTSALTDSMMEQCGDQPWEPPATSPVSTPVVASKVAAELEPLNPNDFPSFLLIPPI